MSAFTERLAARRAAMAIETERVTLALAAHRAAAQEANYREYCSTHRYDPRPADGWTAEQVATMQATQRANTEAQNRTAAAVRDGCQGDDAMGHLVTDPADFAEYRAAAARRNDTAAAHRAAYENAKRDRTHSEDSIVQARAAMMDACQCDDAMGHLTTTCRRFSDCPSVACTDDDPYSGHSPVALARLEATYRKDSEYRHCAWGSCSRLFVPTARRYTYCGHPDCPATRVVPDHAQPAGTDIRA
jgi:hypothetical protein